MRKSNNIIEMPPKIYNYRTQLPLVKWTKNKKNKLYDENDNILNPFLHEVYEQYLMYKWIKPNDIVLELGGIYGIVSCTINSMLNNKKNHVVVEPDVNVINALEKNKKNFGSDFYICSKSNQ
jgi:hypothetical protein